jgi:hypothetical protein
MMSLTEAQVVRYSRQILLAQVGGKGQERLLASGVELVGHGAAQSTAAAYLAASGIGVRRREATECGNDRVRLSETGFLFSARDAERPFGVALDSAVADLNADARTGGAVGLLGEVPGDFSGPAPWVALGWRENHGEVVYRSKAGCAACFAANLEGLSKVPVGALSVLVGTLGALVFQRLCLDASDELGALWIEASGEVQNAPLTYCDRCA